MKKKPKIKWAQLSPTERAYLKMERSEDYKNQYLGVRTRVIESVQDKRKRNRYYQLLSHWCKLQKASDAQNP